MIKYTRLNKNNKKSKANKQADVSEQILDNTSTKNNKKSNANNQTEVTNVVSVKFEESTSVDDVSEQTPDIDNTSTKKTKKPVLFSEEWEQLVTLRTSETYIRDEKAKIIKDYVQKLKELNYKMKKNSKEQKTLFDKIPSLHLNDVKVASKEKRKRSGKSIGGFNKECTVPPILAKYLDIEPDKTLARPAVFTLLNNKFKEEGLKYGQNTILDINNAKLLGKTNGTTIPFSEGQKFLASFYKDINSVNV